MLAVQAEEAYPESINLINICYIVTTMSEGETDVIRVYTSDIEKIDEERLRLGRRFESFAVALNRMLEELEDYREEERKRRSGG